MATERRFRPRRQMKFWCYTDLKTDAWLIEIIAYWKAKKQFADMVKNGLRLMFSLGQGHLDVLFELFPQIETQLAAKYSPPTAPDNSNLERKLERIEQLVLEQGRALPDTRDHFPLLIPAGTKPPAAPVAAVVAAKALDAATISDNFFASMFQ